MSRTDLPEQTERFEFDLDDSYELGEVSEHAVSVEDGSIFVEVLDRDSMAVVVYSFTLDDRTAFWAGVDWCREYGVPGVSKEVYWYDDEAYRLGALYLMRGFELTERESNYNKYGERQFGHYRDE